MNQRMTIATTVCSLLVGLFFCGSARAQEGCNIPPYIGYSGSFQDYPIPEGTPSGTMTFTCKGGDGGDAILLEYTYTGSFEYCRTNGGKGAEVSGTFTVGPGAQALNPGGTLRLIVGCQGGSGSSHRSFGFGSDVSGGGGGTAVLYRPPGSGSGALCTDWIPLVVAGGGGGSYVVSDLFACRSRGGRSGSTTPNGSAGEGSHAGAGGIDGGGGACGRGFTGAIRSTGGGGAFSNSTNCDGHVAGAGCPTGGSGAAWSRNGGYGFGGGGAAQGGGGGGGGYSGGGGGANDHGGGGGGSYVSAWASSQSAVVSANGERNGFVSWTAPINLFVNDTCETAIPIQDGFVFGCNTSATYSLTTEGPGLTSCSGGVDVWYSYTNSFSCDRQIYASMSKDYIPGGISAYDACGGNLVACDTDAGPILDHSFVDWTIPAGATHYIRVAHRGGTGVLRLDVRSEDSRSFILTSPMTLWSTTSGVGASGMTSCFNSLTSPDSFHAYTNISGEPETVTVNTCDGTSFDTVITIFEECTGAQIVCDSDSCGQQSQVTWTAAPGKRYLIRVSGEDGASGDFLLNLTASVLNDTCATARPLGDYEELRLDLRNATPSEGDTGSPNDFLDLWYSYTHPIDSCPAYVRVAYPMSGVRPEIYADCNLTPKDYVPNDLFEDLENDEVTRFIRVTPDETIYFRAGIVRGLADREGAIFEFDAGASDLYQGGVSGYPKTVNIGGFSHLSTLDEDFIHVPSCGNPLTGRWDDSFENRLGYPISITASTCNDVAWDTVIAVREMVTGTPLTEPDLDACFDELACSDDDGVCPDPTKSEVTFIVNPGEYVGYFSYSKSADGAPLITTMTMTATDLPPLNDTCMNAQPIDDGILFGVNDTATTEGPAGTCGAGIGKDMWYSYTNTSNCSRRVTVSLCGSETSFKSVVSVFDACNGNELTCGGPQAWCYGGEATFTLASGVTALIRVSSADPMQTGRFQLTVTSEDLDPLGFGLPGLPCVARNDLCSNALQLIDGAQPGTLANATSDLNPTCASGATQLPDVWYSYTNQAACMADVTISTCFGTGASEYRTLTAFDACSGNELVCDSGGTDPNDPNDPPCATINWSMPPGATHLIRVSGTQDTTSNSDEFTLSISSIGAADRDSDGVEDACDNCLTTANGNQADTDNDGNGDACDLCPGFDDAVDTDNDTVPDGCDQCPGFDDLVDADADGVSDGCDPCPNHNPDDLDGNGTCGAQVVVSGPLRPGVNYTGDLKPYPAMPNSACDPNRPETFDFWTFDAQAGDSIVVEIDRLEFFPDPRFSVWQGNLDGTPLFDFTSWTENPNQTLLASRDNDEQPAAGGNNQDPVLFGFSVPVTGTYTVLVAGVCDSPTDNNPYQIRFDIGGLATITNVTRQTTHNTIQDALNFALNGNLIEIGPGFVFEDGIRFPAGIDVTLRGAGRERTFIDAEADDPGVPLMQMVDSGQTSATLIADLTIQKDADQFNGLGALWLDNVSPRIENVAFVNNYGPANNTAAADVTVSGANAHPVFDRCYFIDMWDGLASVETLNGATISLFNCVFDETRRISDGGLISSMLFNGGTANVINCTLVGKLEHQSATVNVINSAFVTAPQLTGNITMTRSLYPGATGNSIDGTPTFVDGASNVFRLTQTSLGIDAADYAAYVTAGGGDLDAGGQARVFDDPNTLNTGLGAQAFQDIGAFEYFIDSDNDGVGDGSDVCPGFDDTIDTDGDGAPDGCDSCPDDPLDDSDGDGVCDSQDQCEGIDDSIDTDGDTIPDCAEAIGDECAYAEIVGNETKTGSLVDYSGGTGDDDSCASNNTVDKWFRYDSGVNGTLTITTCNPGSEFDSVISVFDGCPETGGQEVACNDDTAAEPPECRLSGWNRLSTVSLPAATDQSYYIRLSVYNDDFLGTGGLGPNYEISFSAEGDGDECTIARIATGGLNAGTLQDNTGASGPNDDSCGLSSNSLDEWFAYTARVGGTVTFSTCSPNTGFNTVLSLFDDCSANGGVELACNDATVGQPACEIDGMAGLSSFEWNVSAGETYYVRVSAKFNLLEPNGPDFELTIQEPDGCFPGDINSDGVVDVGDLPTLVAVLLDPNVATADEFCAADANTDGQLNGLDLQGFVELVLTP